MDDDGKKTRRGSGSAGGASPGGSAAPVRGRSSAVTESASSSLRARLKKRSAPPIVDLKEVVVAKRPLITAQDRLDLTRRLNRRSRPPAPARPPTENDDDASSNGSSARFSHSNSSAVLTVEDEEMAEAEEAVEAMEWDDIQPQLLRPLNEIRRLSLDVVNIDTPVTLTENKAPEPTKSIVVVDTNVFVSNLDLLKQLDDLGDFALYVPFRVLKELDTLKTRKEDTTLRFNARQANDFIYRGLAKKMLGQSVREEDEAANLFEAESADDKILQACLALVKKGYSNVTLLTNDKNLACKGMVNHIKVKCVSQMRRDLVLKLERNSTVQKSSTSSPQVSTSSAHLSDIDRMHTLKVANYVKDVGNYFAVYTRLFSRLFKVPWKIDTIPQMQQNFMHQNPLDVTRDVDFFRALKSGVDQLLVEMSCTPNNPSRLMTLMESVLQNINKVIPPEHDPPPNHKVFSSQTLTSFSKQGRTLIDLWIAQFREIQHHLLQICFKFWREVPMEDLQQLFAIDKRSSVDTDSDSN